MIKDHHIRSCSQVAVSESGAMTAQLMVSTYFGLLRLLSTCAAGSHAVAETLLQNGVFCWPQRNETQTLHFSASNDSVFTSAHLLHAWLNFC